MPLILSVSRLKSLILIVGLLLAINQIYFFPLSINTQTYIFLIGIIILGIPHGAVDVLISTKNAKDNKNSFSYFTFFYTYIGRLIAFLLLLLLIPSIGIVLFIIIASFHFGETDLYKFDINSLKGKLFSFSYGWVIISFIILSHFDEVKTLLYSFESGRDHQYLINWMNDYKLLILSVSFILFFCFSFIYFLGNARNPELSGEFLVAFLIIIFIVYNLPLLLGFTFYFVMWHSIVSLKNILIYLGRDRYISNIDLMKQICFYSLIAITGILLFGIAGFMFVNNNTLVIYVLLGLAVLTAPHMQIMHTMYNNIRRKENRKSLD
ncbi:MAG: Brp/Blh family beta-carotene 15,15'-dioxygenase [Pedobacter sp.]|nr:Brp/Blh family beta-carotene 15,15'-dioxygenase [Pedobacter sp.]